MFIRHRTAENNQRNLSHGFKNILFGDNMHYVDLYSCICRPIGVFGKSGTTKILGRCVRTPRTPPGYATEAGVNKLINTCLCVFVIDKLSYFL